MLKCSLPYWLCCLYEFMQSDQHSVIFYNHLWLYDQARACSSSDSCWKHKLKLHKWFFFILTTGGSTVWNVSLSQYHVRIIDYTRNGPSFLFWSVKTRRMCLEHAFLLMACRGRLHWFQKDAPTLLIYYLSQQFPNVFMVSIACPKSSSSQHDVHFVHCCPIKS